MSPAISAASGGAGIRGIGERSAAYQRRWGWPTLEAARAGHEAVTAWIARVAAFLAGDTSQLPEPDPPGTPASRPTRKRNFPAQARSQVHGRRFIVSGMAAPRRQPKGLASRALAAVMAEVAR